MCRKQTAGRHRNRSELRLKTMTLTRVLAFYKSWRADVWSSVRVATLGWDLALRWSVFPQDGGNECFGDSDAIGGAQRTKRGWGWLRGKQTLLLGVRGLAGWNGRVSGFQTEGLKSGYSRAVTAMVTMLLAFIGACPGTRTTRAGSQQDQSAVVLWARIRTVRVGRTRPSRRGTDR